MTVPAIAVDLGVERRARQTLGSSSNAIYQMVTRAMDAHGGAGTLVDVGCGGGQLWRALGRRCSRYLGLDAVRYDSFPADGEFHRVDLDRPTWPRIDGIADVVTAVETIEHLNDPWTFVRRLASIVRPGGLVIITTPNQLSALSLVTLLVKNRFSAFQDAQFPAHRTALLESDLLRIVREAGLESIQLAYSLHGRLPLTRWHYPEAIARLFPRALSDNVMVIARKPSA